MKRLENESTNRQRSSSINHENEQVIRRKPHRKQQTIENPVEINPIVQSIPSSSSSSQWSFSQMFIPFCLIM